MTEEFNDTIHKLIAKELAGEATEEERARISQWRSESEENERLHEQYSKAWKLSDRYSQTEEMIDVDAEWGKFLARTQNDSHRTSDPNVVHVQWHQRPAFRVAASILFFMAAALVIFLVQRGGDQTYLANETGMVVELPDGSSVHLYSGAELTVDGDFDKETRDISLTGEAFFDVASNPDVPFVIDAKGILVEVLGTSFTVETKDIGEVAVIVETGSVQMSTSSGDLEPLLLSPGDKGLFSSEGELVKSRNQDFNYLAWKTRRIQFDDTNLDEVIRVLSKVYGLEFELTSPALQGCPVTVTFDTQSLESVLEVLGATLDITYEINEGAVTISGDGC